MQLQKLDSANASHKITHEGHRFSIAKKSTSSENQALYSIRGFHGRLGDDNPRGPLICKSAELMPRLGKKQRNHCTGVPAPFKRRT